MAKKLDQESEGLLTLKKYVTICHDQRVFKFKIIIRSDKGDLEFEAQDVHRNLEDVFRNIIWLCDNADLEALPSTITIGSQTFDAVITFSTWDLAKTINLRNGDTVLRLFPCQFEIQMFPTVEYKAREKGQCDLEKITETRQGQKLNIENEDFTFHPQMFNDAGSNNSNLNLFGNVDLTDGISINSLSNQFDQTEGLRYSNNEDSKLNRQEHPGFIKRMFMSLYDYF